MPVPGISTPGVVVHAPGGRMALEIDWADDRPATASVIYRCPWELLVDFMLELRGGFPPNPSGLAYPRMPHAFPLIPQLYCHSVSVRPKDDEVRKYTAEEIADPNFDVFAFHPHALVTARYKAPDWSFDAAQVDAANQIDPGTPILGCRQRVRASTSFLTFDKAKLRYQASGKIVEATDGIPANQAEITLEYPRLAINPTEFLMPFKGKVNNAPLWFLGPEHVLFDNFDVDVQSSITGAECSATLTFLCSIDLSWNERLNDEGEPEAVKFVSSSPPRKPFASTNLHAIF